MPAAPMPSPEVDVDVALVRRLLADQFPDLAGLPIAVVAEGWDNSVFRLGDDLCVRLPRRTIAVGLAEVEQRWLPAIAPALPLPVPAPVGVGQPAHGYPWTWSVCPWLPGDIAATATLADEREAARQLAEFLTALHRTSPPDAPRNVARGVPLAVRTPLLHGALDRLADDPVTKVDRDRVVALWDELVAAPPWAHAPVWVHGDLHPANMLVDGAGRIAAVIDFGELSAGDPATDLVIAWMLFGAHGRAEMRANYRQDDDDTWVRGRAWALALGVAFLAASADHPIINGIGARALAQALDGGTTRR
ncbi:MAG TPA: aminoglycoside phosphotransferase family protein [Acidimicrobiales bacterium]